MSATSALPDKKTIELVARQLGISEAFVEKDWHVTQALSVISQVKSPGFKLIFSGGTALSKAHTLIKRFSEDIDFIIVAKEKTRNRKGRSDLKHDVLKALRAGGFKIEENQVRARNENQFIAIDLEYKTNFARPNSLRPHIQIEMTIKETQLPPVKLPVSSFVNELAGYDPEVKQIHCLDPVENAADKLSVLTWRVLERKRDDPNDDPALVRHIHDLAMLKNIALKSPKFSELVLSCMDLDAKRVKNNLQFSRSTVAEKFAQLISILHSDDEYEKEYEQFVRGVSYSSEDDTPDFKTAVKAILVLVKSVGR